MKPRVSIVVPIYGVEKYLEQCVDSLLDQTLQDIEIILVDDGSPDHSGEIADDYAKRDARVKVIHQKNAGLGPARNAGMAIATGEYVGFVDSDDWVLPGMYEELYKTAIRDGADIVVSGHCDVTNGKVTKVKRHPLAGKMITDKSEILSVRKNLYGHGFFDTSVEAFPMSVWMSVYRNSFIKENRLNFRKIMSEDTIFNLDAYKCANVVSFTGGTDYRYRKEAQESITQTFSEKKRQCYNEFLSVLKQLAASENDEDCILRAKRTAIDYCRLYVGLVGEAGGSLSTKIEFIKDYAEDESMKYYWDNYPVKYLPIQQRIFHWMIVHKWYGTALCLNWIRQELKKRRRVTNGGS